MVENARALLLRSKGREGGAAMLDTIVTVGQMAGEIYVSTDWKRLASFIGFIGQSVIVYVDVRRALKSRNDEKNV